MRSHVYSLRPKIKDIRQNIVLSLSYWEGQDLWISEEELRKVNEEIENLETEIEGLKPLSEETGVIKDLRAKLERSCNLLLK